MILDVILLLAVTLAFIRGWKKGLLWAVCSMIAVFAGIIIAMKLSGVLSEFLFVQQIITGKYTMLISFLILFLLTIFLFRILIKFAEGVLDTFFLGWINHALGAVLYSFFVVFVISTFCWLANQVQLLKPEMKRDSKTYTYIEPVAPETIAFISAKLPYCKNMMSQIQQHLKEVSK